MLSIIKEDKLVVVRALQLGNNLQSVLTFLHIKKGRLLKTGGGLTFVEKPEEDDVVEEELLSYNKSEKIKKHFRRY
jgi:hypothetical protein